MLLIRTERKIFIKESFIEAKEAKRINNIPCIEISLQTFEWLEPF